MTSGATRTILVVDDEPDLLQAVCGFLEDEGYVVRGVSSGSEALALLSEGPAPNLVLLDVMMPGLSGFDVLARMDEIGSAANVPVIMMSAVEAGPRRPHGRYKAFLKKPFDIDKLLGTITRWA